MSKRHECAVLKMVTADPRVPITFDRKSKSHSLAVNLDTRVIMSFCPFCGENLDDTSKSMPKHTSVCRHLQSLSRKQNSSVKFRREYCEYWLFGRDLDKTRLFYCPVCGTKLPLQKNDSRFHKESVEELNELKKLTRNITTVDHAIEQFGPPDVQHGRHMGYLYPEGKRTRFGNKRVLFYENLAKTVDVVVYEGLDGRVNVKFAPKEKKRR